MLDINIERTEKPPDEVIRRAARFHVRTLFKNHGIEPSLEFCTPLGLIDVVVSPSEAMAAGRIDMHCSAYLVSDQGFIIHQTVLYRYEPIVRSGKDECRRSVRSHLLLV